MAHGRGTTGFKTQRNGHGQYSIVSLTQRNGYTFSVAAMTCRLDENMHAVSQHASCGIVVIMIQTHGFATVFI